MNLALLREFLPIIISAITVIVTVVSSHKLISKQVIKNKESKWVDDFRHAMVEFLTSTLLIKPTSKGEELNDFVKKSTMVLLLLDNAKDQNQKRLKEIMAETIINIMHNKETEKNDAAFMTLYELAILIMERRTNKI